MNWKSTSVLSGAGVVATLLAAGTPERLPLSVHVPQPGTVSQVIADASDIEHQAARLQLRLHRDATYTEPARNPFRFEEASPPSQASQTPQVRGVEPAVAAPPAPSPVAAAALRISLVGIATDQPGGTPERTAILSSPFGVFLVKIGEEVSGGQYRVSEITGDAVELVSAIDGTRTRLTLPVP